MAQENKDDFDLEFEDLQANQSGTGAKPSTTTDQGTEIPEKFKGKTPEQLVEMYQNLEKLNGRQAQELGTYRQRVDEILQLRNSTENANKKPENPKPVTVEELLESPDAALDKAIGASPIAQKAEEASKRVAQLETQLARNSFESAYPDYKSDVQDPEFIQWVTANPLRSTLAVRADSQNDFNAAKALWDLWSEHKTLVGNVEKNRKEEQKRKVLVGASTVSNGASAEQKAKPTFSRAKLLDLQIRAESGDARAKAKWDDPAFQQARVEAYREGRVK